MSATYKAAEWACTRTAQAKPGYAPGRLFFYQYGRRERTYALTFASSRWLKNVLLTSPVTAIYCRFPR